MRAAETFALSGVEPQFGRPRPDLLDAAQWNADAPDGHGGNTINREDSLSSTKTSGSWVANEDSYPTPSTSAPSSTPPMAVNTTRRTVLLGVAAQLALLCAVASVLEGLVSLAPLGQLIANTAGDELLSAARAVPALVALQLLLDKTKSSYLLALQLLVVAKIHMRVMFPLRVGHGGDSGGVGTSSGGADMSSESSGIATVALAALMLAHPQLQFERRVAANPRAVALFLFTLAASAMLAGADTALAPVGSHLLLFNCGFLACSTFALAALVGSGGSSSDDDDDDDSEATSLQSESEFETEVPTSSSTAVSTKSVIFAFVVTALLASCVRERVGLSTSAFAASLVAQLVLALLASVELCDGRQHFEEADGDVVFVEDECANGSVFRFIDILVMLVTAACGCMLVCFMVTLVL